MTMKCPYCSSDTIQVKSPFSNTNTVFVGEKSQSTDKTKENKSHVETIEEGISIFQCEADNSHVFYADDMNGNKFDNLPTAKFDWLYPT